MAMHRSTRFWVRLAIPLGLLVAFAVVVPRASEAQPEVAPVAAPAPLAAAKRVGRLAAALKASNIASTKMTTSPAVRVTPAAPRHSSGALITHAGRVSFTGPSAGNPDGTYKTVGGGTAPTADVTMRFPTSSGAVYVLDCSITKSQLPNSKVLLARGGGQGVELPVEDGHVLHAFNAAGAATELALTFTSVLDLSLPNPSFHGCELSKLD